MALAARKRQSRSCPRWSTGRSPRVPQVISRHGRDTAVVVSIDDFRRLTGDDGLKAYLLGAPSLDGGVRTSCATDAPRAAEASPNSGIPPRHERRLRDSDVRALIVPLRGGSTAPLPSISISACSSSAIFRRGIELLRQPERDQSTGPRRMARRARRRLRRPAPAGDSACGRRVGAPGGTPAAARRSTWAQALAVRTSVQRADARHPGGRLVRRPRRPRLGTWADDRASVAIPPALQEASTRSSGASTAARSSTRPARFPSATAPVAAGASRRPGHRPRSPHISRRARLRPTRPRRTSATGFVTRDPTWHPRSLLDIGAGPGVAAWAAAETWPDLNSVTLVEAEPAMVTAGRALAGCGGELIRSARWLEADAAVEPAVEAELVIVSYLLGELGAAGIRVRCPARVVVRERHPGRRRARHDGRLRASAGRPGRRDRRGRLGARPVPARRPVPSSRRGLVPLRGPARRAAVHTASRRMASAASRTRSSATSSSAAPGSRGHRRG